MTKIHAKVKQSAGKSTPEKISISGKLSYSNTVELYTTDLKGLVDNFITGKTVVMNKWLQRVGQDNKWESNISFIIIFNSIFIFRSNITT